MRVRSSAGVPPGSSRSNVALRLAALGAAGALLASGSAPALAQSTGSAGGSTGQVGTAPLVFIFGNDNNTLVINFGNLFPSCVSHCYASISINISGNTIVAGLPERLQLGPKLMGPDRAATLPDNSQLVGIFTPSPTVTNPSAIGSLGGGDVVPVSAPLSFQIELEDATTGQILTMPADVAAAQASFTMPQAASSGTDQTFSWLPEVVDANGHFLGYEAPMATFDPTKGAQVYPVGLGSLSQGGLQLPALIQPASVQNFDPDVHLWSSPLSDAVDFGVAGPQYTTFPVAGPQVGGRILVSNPATGSLGWIDASGMGPAPAS